MSHQVSSATQSCPALCDPMDCSMSGFPVCYQLPEPAQTHVHHIGDAIQPSHPLPPSSPFAFNLSQHSWISLQSKGLSKSLLQHHSSKASIFCHSVFFTFQLSHPYMTTGKAIALTRRTIWSILSNKSNQSILKEISPEYSLEGLMLKLKLQYFGHLMQRTDSLEKTLMLGMIGDGRRRGQ